MSHPFGASADVDLFEFLPEMRRPLPPPKSKTDAKGGNSLNCRPPPAAAHRDIMAQWPFQYGINVVLFAGMGGACQGLEDAGFPVHVAVNHDEIAIAAHTSLNPHTLHLQADIYEVNPLEATNGHRVGILWASPDCRDHSTAKGGMPRSPRVRSMPWQVCRWAGMLRKRGLGPDVIYLENVREIRGWGPLVAKRDKVTGRVIKLDGTVAAKGERVPVREQCLVRDKKRAGRTYRAWVRHIERLGAVYSDRDLCCADYGVPTTRTRLFGIGRFDGRDAIWPAITHGHRKSPAVLAGRLKPHVPAASFIDWSLDLPSIWDRKKPLAPATMKRVAAGMKRFVIDAEKPFIVHLTHHGERAPINLDDAAPTLTGAHRGELAVVGATVIPTCHTSDIARGHSAADASPTVTAGVKRGELAVLGATGIDSARAGFVSTYYGEKRDGEVRGSDALDPLRTQSTENRFGVVGVTIAPARPAMSAYLEEHRQRSVGQSLADPLVAQTTRDHHAVVGCEMADAAAFMIHQRGTGIATSPEDPLRTLATGGGKGGDHIGVGSAWLVQANTGVVGRAGAQFIKLPACAGGHTPNDALSTLTVAGTQQQVASAFLCEHYSSGGQHQGVDRPLNTLSTKDRFVVTGSPLSNPPLSADQMARAREVAEFLRAHGAWSGGEVVTVGRWIIVDIGLRMLKHWEAAAAHELRMPDLIQLRKRDRKGNLVFDDNGDPVWITRHLNKTEAMRLVGNSVPRRMPMILAAANSLHMLSTVAAE